MLKIDDIENEADEIEEIELSQPSPTIQWRGRKEATKPAGHEFQPVYISHILRINGTITQDSTYDDLIHERYFGTFFIHTIFDTEEDHKYITQILIPYLRAVAKAKAIDWHVTPRRINGILGVMIPGRLAAYLVQGMIAVRPPIPYLMNHIFLDGD